MSTKDDVKDMLKLAAALVAAPIDAVANKFKTEMEIEAIGQYIPRLNSEINLLIENKDIISKGIRNSNLNEVQASRLEWTIRNYDMDDRYSRGHTQTNDGFVITSPAYALYSTCEKLLDKISLGPKKRTAASNMKAEILQLTAYVKTNKNLDASVLQAHQEKIEQYGKVICP